MTSTFVPVPGFDINQLRGSTLIFPSVSIGNVPQLAVDLLLSTLDLVRVGCLEDENVVPVLGPSDGGQTGLTLSVEVFQTKDHKWTLVQQRSPTIKHRSHFFTDNLIQFFTLAQFSQIVVLASADGARRIDIQLTGIPIRHISSSTTSTNLIEKLQELHIKPLENVVTEVGPGYKSLGHGLAASAMFGHGHIHPETNTINEGLVGGVQGIQLSDSVSFSTSSSSPIATTTDTAPTSVSVPRIPSGGIARRLHQSGQVAGLPILTLVVFAMEGDNAPDGIFLANVVNTLLNVHVPSAEQVASGQGWKFPKSWDSFYGDEFNQELYQ